MDILLSPDHNGGMPTFRPDGCGNVGSRFISNRAAVPGGSPTSFPLGFPPLAPGTPDVKELVWQFMCLGPL